MKQKPSHIFRFTSLVLTALLLLVAVGGTSWTTVAETAKQTVQVPAKTAKGADAAQNAVVSSTSFEAVVTPAVSFDFAQAIYLLPPVLLLIIEQPKITRLFEIPYYYFSYFRHVFGHHIATNAP